MFDIMRNYKKFFLLSIILTIAGVAAIVVNFATIKTAFVTDIDFSGGTMLQINMEKPFDNDQVRQAVEKASGLKTYSVQKVAGDTPQVMIKLPSIDSDKRAALYADLKKEFGLTSETPLASENISPAISNEILYNAILAVIIASLLILIYVWIRFEFISGVAAIIALLHDVFIMITVYALFRIPINASFIAAVLTIIGYSINDTIIVFDRIRENTRYSSKEGFNNVCEKSIWQTMRRSLNTTGTTVTTLIVLYFIGSPSIKEFAGPLIIGIISGAYSSIFIATPIWSLLKGEKIVTKKVKTA